MLAIGAHVDSADPAAEAAARSADLVQFFLGDPQAWEPPAQRPDLAGLGTASYVHAPYRINIASPNNRLRIPSRKLLGDYADAAAVIGARALIVHGGHVGAGGDVQDGIDSWRKTFERATFPLPIYIENTAGGEAAIARRFDVLGRLWDAIGGHAVGFCLDTCHAYAGGEELLGVVDRVKALTGRIDLVHANDSRDPFGSGRDRHANFGSGEIEPDLVVAVVEAAGAPVVCETPGGAEGQGADIAFLRSRLRA